MWSCDPALTTNIANSFHGAGPLFTQTIQTLLAAHCALVGDHLWPPDKTESVLEDPTFDFIVVGAGSAGSVLANRLTEIPHWKVLLVEAGGNPTISTEVPQLFYNNMDSSEDWQYVTQPQSGACRSYERKGCAWPRGKVLGGCSSINGLFYVRGNKLDYDEWEASGNTGWSYKNVLPYFIKSENLTSILPEKDIKYHGIGGNLNIEAGELHEFEKIIIAAASELGIDARDDINSYSQIGITRSLTTVRDKTRDSTARAFLSPIKDRKNLYVMKNAYVTEILFKPNTKIVTGIKINKDAKDITVNAKKEVIVSAGAINTPQLLLLSGIGPRKHLEDLDIPVKADLPVGENLQDHLFVPIFYKLQGDPNTVSLTNIARELLQYMIFRNGSFASTAPHRVISFLNTTDPKSQSPNIQQHFIVLPPKIANMIDVYANHGLSKEFREKFQKINEDNFMLAPYTVLLRPLSRGRILLKSRNPAEYPLIYANYFDHPDDIKTIVNALKIAIDYEKTDAFKAAGLKLEWIDIDACRTFEKSSDEFLECISRELTFSVYHPTCTAKMGPEDDDTAVVDPTLKVRKVIGLRVIDASIMPNIVRGNTNAPTIMIGEKGADLIKNDWLNKHSEL